VYGIVVFLLMLMGGRNGQRKQVAPQVG